MIEKPVNNILIELEKRKNRMLIISLFSLILNLIMFFTVLYILNKKI